jgi:ribA/ribD-fused uncharacterized protein
VDPIYFYSKTAAYHELSNFSPHGFEEDGVFWPTVEHYFQAQKFVGPLLAEYREKIRRALSPSQAKTLGRSRQHPLRADWEAVKEEIMLRALRRKFAVPALRALLLATGERTLVEASPSDSYWGSGRRGAGRNRLGVLLMQVRAEISGGGG